MSDFNANPEDCCCCIEFSWLKTALDLDLESLLSVLEHFDLVGLVGSVTIRSHQLFCFPPSCSQCSR